MWAETTSTSGETPSTQYFQKTTEEPKTKLTLQNIALVLFLGQTPADHVPAETVKILETVKPAAENKESGGQAAWQCTLCKRMFSSKKYIVSHMKEDHHVTKEKAIDLSITEI